MYSEARKRSKIRWPTVSKLGETVKVGIAATLNPTHCQTAVGSFPRRQP